jgi:hypothetical protein
MAKTMKTGTGITPISDAQAASDGKARGAYNKAHGRVASAPLVGGQKRSTKGSLAKSGGGLDHILKRKPRAT